MVAHVVHQHQQQPRLFTDNRSRWWSCELTERLHTPVSLLNVHLFTFGFCKISNTKMFMMYSEHSESTVYIVSTTGFVLLLQVFLHAQCLFLWYKIINLGFSSARKGCKTSIKPELISQAKGIKLTPCCSCWRSMALYFLFASKQANYLMPKENKQRATKQSCRALPALHYQFTKSFPAEGR